VDREDSKTCSWVPRGGENGLRSVGAGRRGVSDNRTARERLEMTIPQEVAETIVDPKAYADGRIYESYA
jgi:hypothetical protein